MDIGSCLYPFKDNMLTTTSPHHQPMKLCPTFSSSTHAPLIFPHAPHFHCYSSFLPPFLPIPLLWGWGQSPQWTEVWGLTVDIFWKYNIDFISRAKWWWYCIADLQLQCCLRHKVELCHASKWWVGWSSEKSDKSEENKLDVGRIHL